MSIFLFLLCYSYSPTYKNRCIFNSVFGVCYIFGGNLFLKKNYFAGVPGTKGDSSRCQPALCHEGPQEGHTKRYSNVGLGYGCEILRIATFLCFGFWLHWQGKKNKEKWVSWVFLYFFCRAAPFTFPVMLIWKGLVFGNFIFQVVV